MAMLLLSRFICIEILKGRPEEFEKKIGQNVAQPIFV
jgi:hypothetical protein